ncbi:cupin domain-containing protein [Sphingobium sp.]|uniref:cupin domain-containing protein n=1 Tax=Sphingobium sp. TaxID=1912891 RepID=UPI0028BE40EC|nr:cupin domain-containing protein [Sphingobium sp.]
MTEFGQDIRPVRRIVTGENAEGRSVILSDGDTPNWVRPKAGGSAAQVVWATGDSAAQGADPAPAGHPFGFHSPNGTILRIVDFAPDDAQNTDMTIAFLEENKVRHDDKARHFMFHRTESLDYAIVLEGEIYAMMDEGETLMRAGDVLIQRATSHSWSNRSNRFCRMAFVLIAEA